MQLAGSIPSGEVNRMNAQPLLSTRTVSTVLTISDAPYALEMQAAKSKPNKILIVKSHHG